MFRVLFFVAVAVAAMVPAQAYNSEKCSEVPDCLNEYKFKDPSRPEKTVVDYCAKRYDSCPKSTESDMKKFCETKPKCNAPVLAKTLQNAKPKVHVKINVKTICEDRFPYCK